MAVATLLAESRLEVASLYHPVMTPPELMLWGVVLEPGASKEVKVWPSTTDEAPNAVPRMEIAKHRESFREEGPTRN